MRFTIATYNIHKGFSHLKRRMVIHELRDKLHGLDADIVFLQEVQGAHDRHAGRYADWPGKPQHEFIADEVWQEVAYGKTAVYRHGHHGNAVLSRFPIISLREPGHLGAPVRKPRPAPLQDQAGRARADAPLHERAPRAVRARPAVADPRAVRAHPRDACRKDDAADRRRRFQRLAAQGQPHAGRRSSSVEEVFESFRGRTARTFPSVLPMFRLDRIYVRGLRVVDTRVHYAFPWGRLSDHAALGATFETVKRGR